MKGVEAERVAASLSGSALAVGDHRDRHYWLADGQLDSGLGDLPDDNDFFRRRIRGSAAATIAGRKSVFNVPEHQRNLSEHIRSRQLQQDHPSGGQTVRMGAAS